MKTTVLPHIGWALVAIVAYTFGSIASHNPPPALPDQTASVPIGHAVQSQSASGSAVSTSATSDNLPPLSPEQARVLTFEILREPNRFQRNRRFLNLLDRVTADNWREVLEGIERQKTYEGRELINETVLALERIGEVVGREALEDALSRDVAIVRNATVAIMNGWAGMDPDAAFAWYQEQSPALQKSLKQSLISGLTRSDPGKSLEFHDNAGFDLFTDSAYPAVQGAIQIGGISEAERLLDAFRARTDLSIQLRQKVFDAVSIARRNMAERQGDPLDSLEWAEKYLGADSPVSGNSIQNLITSAAKADPFSALDWVERHAHQLDDKQAATAFPNALAAVGAKDPERFAAWVNANPNHPQLDGVLNRYVIDLRHKGQLTTAREWAAIIQDEKLRGRAEKSIRSAETARASKNPATSP